MRNDYGKPFRQRLIHRQANLPVEQRKRDYQRRIEEGMSEYLSATDSQYHPIEEWDTWWGRLTVAIGWTTVFVMLALAVRVAYAEGDRILVPLKVHHTHRSDSLNETPLGVGYQHASGLYGMGFKDSFRAPAWIAGYRMPLIGDVVRLDGTVFVMTKRSVNDYRPFVGALPILSVGGTHRVEMTTIPKMADTKGAIVFVWASARF